MIEILETKTVVEVGEVRTEVTIQAPGPQGSPGPAGPQGPPGVDGADGINADALTYTHVQAVASATWTIVHSLGTYLGGITVVDSAGTAVVGDVSYIDDSTVVITFAAPFTGTAYLS